jgi:hypothetical protein
MTKMRNSENHNVSDPPLLPNRSTRSSPRAHWINGRNIQVDGLEQPHAPLDRRPF